MVEYGWPHDDFERIYDKYGKHDSWNVPCSGHVVGMSFGDWDPYLTGPRTPPEGYEPRHAWPEKLQVGTVIYDGVREQFAMVVPKGGPFGDRQPVFSGPHTNYGQPCGGYGCNGHNPYCDECQDEISAEHDERWAEYYADIIPIPRYGGRWGDEPW